MKYNKTALAIGGLVAGSVLASAAFGAAYQCIHVRRSRFGFMKVYLTRDPTGERVRVLNQGGVYQSASYLKDRCFEPVFAYYRGFDALFHDVLHSDWYPHHILLLGGGGFSYPKHLLTTQSHIHLDVVEIDAAIIREARRWFFLDKLEARLEDSSTAQGNSLRIIEAEGREFLERGVGQVVSRTPQTVETLGSVNTRFSADMVGGQLRVLSEDEIACPHYDVIIQDVFVGRNPALQLASVEAARAVRARLASDGLYLVNVVSSQKGANMQFLQQETASLLEVFQHVHIIETSDELWGGERNFLLLATDRDAQFVDEIAFNQEFLGTPLHDA
ncbi:fused MFS/spermidine synthase [Collinsella sp. zg1085]|uniref:spermidine synthase n=1 Tax=Collinsella sp. zg1085 TaxID=2844380 RepID=UPI001C0C26A3|nr:fused MFS/spermidine synthase [Collinsella sp. zg1085]QWT17242.1 fused MFS/spermidine synthase [Collinsella sp. zg1085]